MREYYFPLAEHLKNGLRPDRKGRRNDLYLLRCLNMKPTPWGLSAVPAITNPFESVPTADWPFPQLIRGKSITLLATQTAIYTVDEGDWSTNPITTYDLFSPLATKAIFPDGPWHFVDLGSAWAMTNGTSLVLKMGHDEKVYVQESNPYVTGCFHKGRAVFGGFPEGLWVDGWEDYFEDAGEISGLTASSRIGLNYVAWSMAGGGDVFWWLLKSLAESGLVEEGGYDSGRPLFMDMWRRGDWGWMPMDWEGEVLQVRPLGDKLMVYGNHGISVMFPVLDPIATYGQRTLLKFGIAGRAAAGGDDSRHVFLDQSGVLWTIDEQLSITRLGYQEFFETILSGEVLITHDPQRGDYWIATDEGAYVLSAQDGKLIGLGESWISPTSLHHTEGGLIGLTQENLMGESVKVTTETLDLGTRGMKTVQSIDLAQTGLEEPRAATWWRNDPAVAFKKTNSVPFSMEGYAVQPASGVELRVEITAASADADAKLDNVNVHWKLTDKRFTRGAFAPLGVSSGNANNSP